VAVAVVEIAVAVVAAAEETVGKPCANTFKLKPELDTIWLRFFCAQITQEENSEACFCSLNSAVFFYDRVSPYYIFSSGIYESA